MVKKCLEPSVLVTFITINIISIMLLLPCFIMYTYIFIDKII